MGLKIPSVCLFSPCIFLHCYEQYKPLKTYKRARGVVQVVDCLTSKHKVKFKFWYCQKAKQNKTP
jgi:hypothetical protein